MPALAPAPQSRPKASTASESESSPRSSHTADPAPGAGIPLFLQRRQINDGGDFFVQRESEETEEEEEEVAIQTKLSVNEPNDAFEEEADNVADRVMRMPETTTGGNGAQEDEEEVAVQTKLSVNEPNDAFEEEADEAADQVMRMPETTSGGNSIFEEEGEETLNSSDGVLRRKAADRGAAGNQGTALANVHTPTNGSSLSSSMRRRIEPVLGANLSNVQVHNDAASHRAAHALHARAFTHANHIWLGANQSANDVGLMAHESTHVVQQRAAPTSLSTALSPVPQIQRLFDFSLDDLPGIDAADIARRVPGFTLFTVIIGYNPLTDTEVDRNAINLLQGLMELVPSGADIFDALQERGILQAAFEWVEGELERLNLTLDGIMRILEAAWEEIDLIPPFSITDNLDIIAGKFGTLYKNVKAFASSLVSHIVDLIKDAAIDFAEGLLAENRAWELIKKVIRYDPLRNEAVESTTVEILEDFLMLIGKEQELEQMRLNGTLEATAAWLDTQLVTFLDLLIELSGLFTSAWEAIQPENLPDLVPNLQNLANQVIGFLQRVWDFATTVAEEVLRIIKDALLGWLSEVAHEVPGFHLLTVILGKNPFTEERVPRTAQNLIRGFITLLPGGEGIYSQLAETGTIARAAARIEGAMEQLGISQEFIVGLFTEIWDSLTIADIATPLETFARIINRFGEPISRLFEFVGVVLREMFFIILELMNFPADLIGSIVSNAMQAIEQIKNDPIGFFENMLEALKLGFSNFFDNILTHLMGGLADWLFRGLREAGVEPPADLSLQSILDFVLEALGITMENLWSKLAERIGQENVDRIRGAIDRLVGIWSFVRDVQERGVVAIWEYIESQISNLWDMVLEKAQEWIMDRIISKAIQWLLSLLDVTGIMPVINACIAFFNAIQSAIEYLRDMLAIVNDYVSTIAAVARGQVQPGAEKLETGLGNSIPVAIGFLANQFGLGNIAEKISEIIGGLREMIDRGINWLLDQAMRLWDSIEGMLGLESEEGTEEETPDARTADEKQRDLMAAINEAQTLLDQSESPADVTEDLPLIQRRYSVAVLILNTRPNGDYYVHAEINPTADTSDKDLGNVTRPSWVPAFAEDADVVRINSLYNVFRSAEATDYRLRQFRDMVRNSGNRAKLRHMLSSFEDLLMEREAEAQAAERAENAPLTDFEAAASRAGSALDQASEVGEAQRPTRVAETATPKHHVFPQARESWFVDHGFVGHQSIHRFTVELDRSEHEAIHGGGNYKLGQTTGWDWNSMIMSALEESETAKGEQLNFREVWTIVTRQMRRYGIRQNFVPYR